jgi:hypothetical protein
VHAPSLAHQLLVSGLEDAWIQDRVNPGQAEAKSIGSLGSKAMSRDHPVHARRLGPISWRVSRNGWERCAPNERCRSSGGFLYLLRQDALGIAPAASMDELKAAHLALSHWQR